MDDTLALSARGDGAAFGQVVREHQSLVFSLAYHFLRDRARAEEVSQEVFLRLYQNLRSIKSRAHLLFWLRKVAWRLCIDESRRGPAANALGLEEIAEPAIKPRESDPILDDRLRQLVASLPAKPRMMVILRYQEELDFREIAEVMEIPVNTVKSGLHRALAVLRTKLARTSGEIAL
jgi:RNA polymerase sigma-70 factor (ECF subfamily)